MLTVAEATAACVKAEADYAEAERAYADAPLPSSGKGRDERVRLWRERHALGVKAANLRGKVVIAAENLKRAGA